MVPMVSSENHPGMWFELLEPTHGVGYFIERSANYRDVADS